MGAGVAVGTGIVATTGGPRSGVAIGLGAGFGAGLGFGRETSLGFAAVALTAAGFAGVELAAGGGGVTGLGVLVVFFGALVISGFMV